MKRIVKSVAMVGTSAAVVVLGAGVSSADSHASGHATHSPGVLSGNLIQVPVHIPVNVCGNTVNVIGVLNPAFGNHCTNR
ncbi:chaplin [Streptomyces sp. ERV7]|uniref:chaplin n=1 Tax=Streptomyces sp. ERV7 TaxID=1322334 RepID=UPI0007F4E9A9|nr:chaplin [Streptomyces sp. ERV7]OAR22084.1 chaplin [Streptomyces sp. ERV7]